MKFFKFIRQFLLQIKDCYRMGKTAKNVAYRITEIDTEKNQIIFYCHGSSTHIKTSIAEAVVDPVFINGIFPQEACWLGYFHGKALREGKLKTQQSKNHFPNKTSDRRYNIASFDYRELKVTYVDIYTRASYTKKAIDLAQDNSFLENISPTQACYIGIWAGFAVAKYGVDILTPKASPIPYLRIIK